MYTKETHPHIAIDFDETIAEDLFPHIGEVREGAIETIKALLDTGYHVHVWTARGGYSDVLGTTQEQHILRYLQDHGVDTVNIEVNEHFQYYLARYPKQSPKIAADIYIDDKNVGVNEIDWYRIRELFKDIEWNNYK